MTDAIPAANDAAQSQVIENREADATALGRGAEVTPEAAPKPDAKEAPKSLSTREALEKAFREGDTKREAEKSAKPDAKDDTRPDDAKAEKAKADAPKDNAAVKTDAKAEETAPKAEQGAPDKAAAGQGGDEVRPSEGRKHVDPPARFLPEARAKWANTPNEIKATRCTAFPKNTKRAFRKPHRPVCSPVRGRCANVGARCAERKSRRTTQPRFRRTAQIAHSGNQASLPTSLQAVSPVR